MRAGRVAFAIALAVAVAAAYRFSPATPAPLRREHCRVVLEPLRDLAPDMSCDSPSFLELAADPALLLAPSRWQSRPLHVVSGTLLGIPFGSLADDRIERLRATYVGFVLFNVLALAAAVFVFETLLAGTAGAVLARTLAVALVANDVVKTMVWSPHLQMMNVLQPLLLVWVIRHVATRATFEPRRAIRWAALWGLAPLFYGSGFVFLPGLLVGLLARPETRHPGHRARTLATAVAMAAAFAVPLAAWVTVHLVRNGAFYTLETGAYRQFVWIVDRGARDGPAAVAGDLATAAAAFAGKAMLVGWFPLSLLAGAVVFAAARPRAARASVGRAAGLVGAALAALALDTLFFVTLGYYTERLSLNVVPPLLVVAGVLLSGPLAVLSPARRRLAHAGLLGVVLLFAVWQARRPGPWSFHQTAIRVGVEPPAGPAAPPS